LGAHDGRTVDPIQGRRKTGNLHPSGAIGFNSDHTVGTQSDQTQRPIDCGVLLRAHHHVHRRRTNQAGGIHVVTVGGQDGVSAGQHPGRVGALPAGGETDRAPTRQVERFQYPPRGHRLHCHDTGIELGEHRILVPCRHQPVGTERRRQGPSGDQREIPSRACCRQTGLRHGRQFTHDIVAGSALIGELLLGRADDLGSCRFDRRGSPGYSVEPLSGQSIGGGQHRVVVGVEHWGLPLFRIRWASCHADG